MGGGKGSAPKPVDPYKAADAQTGANIGAAIANQTLGNVNQVTPYGNLTYNQTGSMSFKDPTSGKTYNLPKYTATTKLSGDQQKLLDTKTATAGNMAGIAKGQSQSLAKTLGKSVALPTPQTMTALSNTADKFSQDSQNQSQLKATATNQTTTLKGAGAIDKTISDAGNIQKGVKSAGAIDSTIANAGKIGTAIKGAGAIDGTIDNAGKITKNYTTDFSADRQKVEDALMGRMQPGMDRDRARMETNLSNRGIKLGGAANDRANFQLGQKENDARMAAILGAGQEQGMLATMANQAANFQNSAQAQQYGQNANNAAFANSAQGQQFGQNAQQLAAQNSGQQQLFNQNAAQTAQQNAAQNQQFNQNATGMQLGNAAQGQQYQQNANNVNVANAGQAQQFGQNLASGQFSNQAKQQEFANLMAKTGFNNQAKQQEFGNAFQKQGFNNQVDQQNFGNSMQKLGFNNQVGQQAFTNAAGNQNNQVNLMNSLLSGGQVQNPMWAPSQGQGIAPTDISGLMGQQFQQQQANYQNNQGGGLMGGLFGLGSAAIMASDRRLKTAIEFLGMLGDLPIYAWTYIWGGPRFVGVMAQDMLVLRPAAVVHGPYLAVDYRRLGL